MDNGNKHLVNDIHEKYQDVRKKKMIKYIKSKSNYRINVITNDVNEYE